MADINKALNDLDWQPKYDLISGLKESFQNDYLVFGSNKIELDFAVDDDILKHQ